MGSSSQALEPPVVAIFGATSCIAEHVGRIYASSGSSLVLISRNGERQKAIAKDYLVRGAVGVRCFEQDLGEVEVLSKFVESLFVEIPSIDTVIIAHGVLPNQEEAQDSPEQFQKSWDVNFTSPALIVMEVVKQFQKKGEGRIGVITSVAGDRGRKSNYVYGSAKGALSLYLQGVRNRLGKTDISVTDIRPGFVDTPMTADRPKGPLFAEPSTVALGIHRALQKKRDIVYLPWFWMGIMCIIRNIPERVFKRLSL